VVDGPYHTAKRVGCAVACQPRLVLLVLIYVYFLLHVGCILGVELVHPFQVNFQS
jgi:hypothetical protein